MNYELRIKKLRNSGYTIIETMIAVSLFITITMTGIGALLNANLLHEKSSDMRSILDNLSFIMEDMSRNLRTGYNYYCVTGDDDLSSVDIPQSGPSCWGISFKSAPPTSQWIYYISTTSDNGYGIFRSVDGETVQLTSDEIDIDLVSGFSVLGAEPPPDDAQPFVTIRLVGKIILKDFITPFSLQTSVSQRLVDIE